jgi:hypothetical protein
MPKLAIFARSRTAREISLISAHAMNAPLTHTAELWVSPSEDNGVLLGAFQRAHEIEKNAAPIFRRASGGPAITVSRGTIHIALALAHPAALVACDAPRLVNRYVRPLMRALSGLGEKTPYFGRDWLSAQHRPVAWVGFGHDFSSKRALFEAVVGVNATWSLDRNRASFLGKSEITLEEAVGHTIAMNTVVDAVADEYANAFEGERSEAPAIEDGRFEIEDDPNWTATIDEAIGTVAAGFDRNGRLKIGGQFFASRDAIARLEHRVASFDRDTPLDVIGAAVDAELARPGVAIHGIKSLISIRDVIARVLALPN